MKAYHEVITKTTKGSTDILDITQEIQTVVSRSGVETGMLTAMVVGSTAAISTLEYEPGLVHHDLNAAMETLAPENGHYQHEETWQDNNGHSHVRSALTGTSQCFPIAGGRVPLGTWQQVVLIDYDTRARRREIVVTAVGL